MPLSEYNFERFFAPSQMPEEKVEKEFNTERKQKQNKEIVESKKSKTNIKKVKPKSAHSIALGLIKDTEIKNKLRNIIGTLIVNKQNLTRIDVVIDQLNDEKLRDLYGMTKEHFKDIENGNLVSFDLVADGQDLAITFKRKTGERAIRPVDERKLAEILDLLFKTRPSIAPPDLTHDVIAK